MSLKKCAKAPFLSFIEGMTMQKLKFMLPAVALSGLVVASAPAAVVVTYDFTNAASGSFSFTPPSTAVHPDVTAEPFTYVSISGGTDRHRSGINNSADATVTQIGNPAHAAVVAKSQTTAITSGESAAITNDKYLTFTVDPKPGFLLTLTSLTADFAQSGGGNDDDRVFLRTSLDGYSGSVYVTGGAATDIGGASAIPYVYANQTFTFSGSQYQNITDPVTFRFYFLDSSQSNTRSVIVDNVVLNGSVVPEPASLSLLGLSGLVMLRRTRRVG